MCSGSRPDVVCSICVFMLVDMFMLCYVMLSQLSDFGPMQRARPWLVPDSGPMQFPDIGLIQWARPNS